MSFVHTSFGKAKARAARGGSTVSREKFTAFIQSEAVKRLRTQTHASIFSHHTGTIFGVKPRRDVSFPLLHTHLSRRRPLCPIIGGLRVAIGDTFERPHFPLISRNISRLNDEPRTIWKVQHLLAGIMTIIHPSIHPLFDSLFCS